MDAPVGSTSRPMTPGAPVARTVVSSAATPSRTSAGMPTSGAESKGSAGGVQVWPLNQFSLFSHFVENHDDASLKNKLSMKETFRTQSIFLFLCKPDFLTYQMTLWAPTHFVENHDLPERISA